MSEGGSGRKVHIRLNGHIHCLLRISRQSSALPSKTASQGDLMIRLGHHQEVDGSAKDEEKGMGVHATCGGMC